jgi:hypothetical protein
MNKVITTRHTTKAMAVALQPRRKALLLDTISGGTRSGNSTTGADRLVGPRQCLQKFNVASVSLPHEGQGRSVEPESDNSVSPSSVCCHARESPTKGNHFELLAT